MRSCGREYEQKILFGKICKKKLDHHQKSSCSSPARLRQIEDKETYERGDQNGENSSKTENATPLRSEYSLGLGKLLSAIRASTNEDTIGSTQAIAYLEKETIYANITRYGEAKATIYDYSIHLIQFMFSDEKKIHKLKRWICGLLPKKQESCKLKEKPGNVTLKLWF